VADLKDGIQLSKGCLENDDDNDNLEFNCITVV
jgi:uncharacterized protein YuzB (UPF0349 family)